MHDDHPVGERHRLDLVMGDVDAGGVARDVQPLDLGPHLLAQLGIKRADRFVHQQRLGPAHQRAADGDALHVAARERRGAAGQQAFDAEDFRDLLHLASRAPTATMRDGAQREGDVLVHRHMRVEREGLEHEGDVAVGGLEILHLACRRW